MTKTKSTKRALLMSAMALLLCVSMLIGSTYAWFTDTVTSSGNIIKSGTLDVTMEWFDGTQAVPEANSADWIDASTGAIFNSELWEPGYTAVRHIKIANEGTLALKYQLNIIANGNVSELAEVIDVYYLDPAQAITNRTDLSDADCIGTLQEVLAGIRTSAFGNLLPTENHTITLALKMQETAGNEYQNLAIGSSFSIQLLATQLTEEKDSFDENYDGNAWLNEADYSWYDPANTTHTIKTAAELAGLAAIVNGNAATTYSVRGAIGADSFKGETVVLAADIDLNGMPWMPIGNSSNSFKGTFDGNGHTVSDLVITGYNSNVGLFGYTTDGEIKNLTVENASVSGRLNVAVVAGTPYTSKFTNIDVIGHVEVKGMAYVGAVGGKNAYADWSDITVDVDATSFVEADSNENGKAYRTYVGGVVGFNGEGGHTFKNITTNIAVRGSVCDIGGVFGIAHYNNKFQNISCSANVSSSNEADELGGIAGVWHNGADVTFDNCVFTGTVSDKNGPVSGCNLVGGAYNSTDAGKLVVDGKVAVVVANNLKKMQDAINDGVKVIDAKGANLGDFYYDVKFDDGVVVKNAKFTYFYGGYAAGTVTFENCEFVSDHSYSAHFDSGNGKVIFNNCLFDGWSSFGSAITGVEMNGCTFKKTYNYGILRFYQDAVLTDCEFEAEFEAVDTNVTGKTVEFKNCTGLEGKIKNNGANKGIWIVDGVDVSSSVESW